jgi:hypothetical protein
MGIRQLLKNPSSAESVGIEAVVGFAGPTILFAPKRAGRCAARLDAVGSTPD